jgi:hypothetical protein
MLTDITRNSRQVATIYAGPKGNKNTPSWKVHTVFLSHHSSVISGIFKEQAMQKQDHVLCWPADGYDNIALFVQWVYTGQLATPDVGKANEFNTISKYVGLWLMAKDLEVPSLQNQSLYLIHHISKRFSTVATEEFPRIWKKTSPGSPLRSYFLELCCQLNATFFTSSGCEKFSKEMLVEMMATMVGQKDIQKVKSCLDPSNHLEKFYV